MKIIAYLASGILILIWSSFYFKCLQPARASRQFDCWGNSLSGCLRNHLLYNPEKENGIKYNQCHT